MQIVSGILMMMLINSASFAQGEQEKAGKEIAEMQTQKLETAIHLTRGQSERVMEINQQFLKDLRVAFNDREEERLLAEAKILRSLHERKDALKKVLSKDQFTELLLMEASRYSPRGGRIYNL